MDKATITRHDFLADRQGRTFSDVLNDREQPFADVFEFFSDEARQRRMEESEIHHDRPPLAGVVRELESQSRIHDFLSAPHPQRTKRFRQAVGVVVRMIMERRGWKKTGKKGSLGVRKEASGAKGDGPCHNSGGLSLWFLRAERYEPLAGQKFPSVRHRARELSQAAKRPSDRSKRDRVATSRPTGSIRRSTTHG